MVGSPLAQRLSQPTQPREAQLALGQQCCEVSTWRGRPRREVIGGGAEGSGAAGPWAACSQVAQGGLRVRLGNGFGSLERWRGSRGLDGL